MDRAGESDGTITLTVGGLPRIDGGRSLFSKFIILAGNAVRALPVVLRRVRVGEGAYVYASFRQPFVCGAARACGP